MKQLFRSALAAATLLRNTRKTEPRRRQAHHVFLPALVACAGPFALLMVSFVLNAADSAGVTYISADKVAAALAKGGSLVTAPDLLVSGSHREKGGKVEIHDKETDIFYVTDGAATLVTGGTMIGGQQTKPGQHLGTGIKGGTAHQLTKGDVVVVPAGTPHWFKDVPKSVSYYVVKVLKQ